ncbi:protein D7-like [Periplaneta americana]|uniref:protein D7-like n=1 Tax=Periplaneta americana TaxID=6978 RepID=UPI0037E94760
MIDTDLLIPCPYNLSHSIFESRMQAHLVKCARNNPAIKMLVCPFNATHRLRMGNYICHINTCPNRKVIEGLKYETRDQVHFQLPPYEEPICPPLEENWDEEGPTVTYNPQAYAESSLVLRKPTGVTKSERKAFYQSERRRLNQIQGIYNEVPVTGTKEAYDVPKYDQLISHNGTSSADEVSVATSGLVLTDGETSTSGSTNEMKKGDEDPTEKLNMVPPVDEVSDINPDDYERFNIDPSMGLGRGYNCKYRSQNTSASPGQCRFDTWANQSAPGGLGL